MNYNLMSYIAVLLLYITRNNIKYHMNYLVTNVPREKNFADFVDLINYTTKIQFNLYPTVQSSL